jgi:peptidoglycan/xylan/chitin deacetylase (PgdA/CDA1 family)
MSSSATDIIERIRQKTRRIISERVARRDLAFQLPQPIISFTFDDFPQNAAAAGGRILKDFGVTATYYISVGLLGTMAPTGQIVGHEHLPALLSAGNELGCHTFDHCHAWETDARTFVRSLDRNQEEIKKLIPSLVFETMSYPISAPNPGVKREAGKRFAGCRGGGQAFNVGVLDRNHLKAFFLEKTRGRLEPVQSIIDQNRAANGWLIFATHDIDKHPTPYGCTPAFFAATVERAVKSGAVILPVAGALRRITGAA